MKRNDTAVQYSTGYSVIIVLFMSRRLGPAARQQGPAAQGWRLGPVAQHFHHLHPRQAQRVRKLWRARPS